MTRFEKIYWCVIVAYGALLIASAFGSPHWRTGLLAWNPLFQTFGPTLGTLLISAGALILMLRRRISVANGLGGTALLTAVSLICLAITLPPKMHI